jgi:hypothetical protein
MEWWTRVFQHVKFNPEIQSIICCDNEQTVRIVKKRTNGVDTHQMWVRQEVQEGRLYLEWCSTVEIGGHPSITFHSL